MSAAHCWSRCVESLQLELPEQQYNTWIRPLVVETIGSELVLFAPNRFIHDWVSQKFFDRIQSLISFESGEVDVRLDIVSNRSQPNVKIETPELNQVLSRSNGSLRESAPQLQSSQQYPTEPNVSQQSIDTQSYSESNVQSVVETAAPELKTTQSPLSPPIAAEPEPRVVGHKSSSINEMFTFDTFVEGKSNQLALAATKQVALNPGTGYNPLFIYGGVGLGKTHLMHAVGNALKQKKPNANIVYLHSERFVADMVKALQLNSINDFKRYYRSVDALLIDDIQFFANKDRSQEEFFHTFNSLFEGGQQMIFTCDRYPKEIDGLEERLKSRFGWGLTVSVEPPELETRAAILMKKAAQVNIELSADCAFFIAERIRSNVRELEGALKRVIANAHFSGRPITIELIKESLKDLLALQERLVTVDNIQKVVAEYYKIKLHDLLSKKRTRSLARPRQVAMNLSKELTSHSLPEIGEAFGGRDHTTVLHACRKVKELENSDADMREDLKNLNRILST